MKAATLRRIINLWPPFLFAGIRATRIAADYSHAEVELRAHWYNRNYVGTHFGGSLFAMTDPWYMLLLMQRLGTDYLVWDRHSSIDFVAPGRGTVKARFEIDEQQVTDIIAATDDGEKHLPLFEVNVVDEAGQVVAQVRKTVYVRKKRRNRPTPP